MIFRSYVSTSVFAPVTCRPMFLTILFAFMFILLFAFCQIYQSETKNIVEHVYCANFDRQQFYDLYYYCVFKFSA